MLRAKSEADDLVRLFGWSDDELHDRCCADLDRTHVNTVATKLSAKLDPASKKLLQTLRDDRYFALLRGPDTFHATFYEPAPALGASVATWVAVEVAGQNLPTTLDGRQASATRDRLVTARSGRVTNVELLPWLDGTSIVLDLHSDLPERARLGVRHLVSPTLPERELAVAKLEAALELLDHVSPLANDLVLRMIDVICLRSSTLETRFVTATDRTTISVAHLVNVHLPGVSTIELASVLVREAVNQALYRWELTHPLITATEDITLRSPWTGQPQDLYGFVHGCFAWYAVASLWRRTGSPRPDFDAEAGFARRPLAYIGELASHVSLPIAAAIDDMTHLIIPTTVKKAAASRPHGW